jgi:hypothetical protein
MAAFNILEIKTECPNCKTYSSFEAEFRFGFTKLDKYLIGDKVEWGGKGYGHSRPSEGNFTGEGYVECRFCHKDFWILILVENDTIKSFKIDTNKTGYIK